MVSLPAEWREQIGLDEFRAAYPELGIKRGPGDDLRLAGALTRVFRADGLPDIEDSFDLEIVVPQDYPERAPSVFDRGGRVRPGYHRLKGGAFCLGSPLRIAMFLRRRPSLLAFAGRFIVPYLYRYSHIDKLGQDPWPDLDHNKPGLGLIEEYSRIVGAETPEACMGLIKLLSLRKRVANKRPCPCGSGLRLGRCHNRRINGLRSVYPRSRFKAVHQVLLGDLSLAEKRRSETGSDGSSA